MTHAPLMPGLPPPAPGMEDHAARFRAVALAAAGVVSATTFDDLKGVLREACATVLEFDVFTLSLYDTETRTLEVLAAEETEVVRPVREGTLAGTPSMRVIEGLRSLRIGRRDDPARVGSRLIGDASREPESVIMSPILHGEEPLGILSVQAYAPERYAAHDVELLEILASLAASAILNVRLSTRRRVFETALRASRDRLEALVSAAPVAIVTTDPAGRVESWNPAAEAMIGVSASVIRGGRISDHLPDLGSVCTELQLQLDASGSVAAVEVVHVRPDGRHLDLALSCARIGDGAGGPVEILYTLVDLSEQKAAEAALRSSEERFRHAQKMEAVGRLAGGVARRFDDALTAILANAERAVLTAGVGGDTRRELEAIRSVARDAATLTRDLIAFGRPEAPGQGIGNLNAELGEMLPVLTRLVGEDIDFLVDLCPDILSVTADPAHLEQIVLNLVANARDAMPEGGRVVVRTRPVRLGPDEAALFADPVSAGRYATLSVTDDGCGMEAAVLERAFEPFFTTQALGKGAGLGLSTAYAMARRCGGCIEAESTPGEGARFTVYLPQADGSTARAAANRSGPSSTIL